uniref:Uncharacterized protein n=1 Tax=Panagrolaimus sp. ES5 TaxID=591445 RepID=A0AC34FTM0_9BILA
MSFFENLVNFLNPPAEGYIAYVKVVEGKLWVSSVDNQLRWNAKIIPYTIENAKTFIDTIPSLFCNKTKHVAFILNIFDYIPSGFLNNYHFIKVLATTLKANNLPCIFISDKNFITAQICLTLPFNDLTTVKKHTILAVVIYKDGFDVTEFTCLNLETISTYIKVTTLHQHKVLLEENKSVQVLHDQIIGSGGFNKIILSSTEQSMPLLKFVKEKIMHAEVKEGIVTILDNSLQIYTDRTVVEIAHSILGESRKFLFDYTCIRKYFVSHIIDGKEIELMAINVGESLSSTKTHILGKFCFEVFIKYVDQITGKIETAEKVILPKTCHSTLLTFTVDFHNWPSLTTERMTPPNITSFPSELNHTFAEGEEKIPIIGFFGFCSVICICKNGVTNYSFLEGWNGSQGNAMIISFAKKKPEFGMKILETQNLSSSFVVYDLIKIMSMPSEDIQMDDEWGFKITADDEHPILLEFDKFDESEKIAASPSFLMAMLLKKQLKVIAKEMEDKKPENIGFFP